jgi:hypothetical protein
MKKLFTISVVILPLIMVYRSPISGLDLGTFWFLCLSIFLLLKSKRIQLSNKPLLIFLTYTLISTLISILLQSDLSVILILRTGKFIALILIILYLGYHFFDIQIGIKALKVVTFSAVIYIILQTIMYKFLGILLPRGFLSLIVTDYYSNIDYAHSASIFYRPTGFFIEPASFSQYTLLYLTYSLFGFNSTKRCFNWKHAVFVSLGIILSGSGQGLLLLVIVWLIWFITRVLFGSISFKGILLLFIILIIGTVLIPPLLETSHVTKTLTRVFGESGLGFGDALMARTKGFDYFSNLEGIYKLIGMGYGNVPENIYFNSTAYTLYCSGILGMFLVVLIYISLFVRGNSFQKVFTIIYFILIMGSATFTAANICFFLSFLISKKLSNTKEFNNSLND